MQRAPGFNPSPQVRPIESPFARRPSHEFGGLGLQGLGNVPPFIDLIAPGENFRMPATFTRNSAALRTNRLATLESMAVNQPLWDYNPNTKRTQLQINTPLAGAIIGASFATGWIVGGIAGATRGITGIGEEYGMQYNDIRIQSASWPGAGIVFRPMASALKTAKQGEIYTGSFFARMIDGSVNGFSQLSHTIIERNNGAYLSEGGSSSGVTNLERLATGNLQRFVTTKTITNASTNQAEHYFYFNAPNGAVIDITIRVYHPQFEPSSVATEPMVNPSTTSPISYAPNRGLRVFEPRTNKCTYNNHSPTNTTGISTGGDAARTISVVNDAVLLAEAGINVGNGNVYRLDNSAGATPAWVDISGQVGNVNPHAFTAWCRCTGTASIRRGAIGSVAQQFVDIASYQKFGGVLTPGGVTNLLNIHANAGAVVWFTLGNLQEGTFIADDILVSGAQATRFGDSPIFTDLSWFNPVEGTFIIEFETQGTNGVATERLFTISNGTESERIDILNNAGQWRPTIVSGGAATAQANLGAVTTGVRNKIVLALSAGGCAASLNNGALVTFGPGAMPVGLNQWRLFGTVAAAATHSGWCPSLRYCPIRVPNSMVNLL